MRITLERFIRGPEFTIGSLSVNGEWLCWTGEDAVRDDPNPSTPQNEGKVYGQTAIPAGTYHVIVNLSPRLKKRMPRLLNVPGFDGILIHKGNDAGDTSGCILVGAKVDSPTRISDCSKVFDELFQKIDYAYASGEGVTIEIVNRWETEQFGSLADYSWSLQ
jgi:hypothetical protein